MAKDILIKPIISEKSEYLSETLGQYSFVVNNKANKIEIKKAIEGMYSVTVESVNTSNMPAKQRVRNTKSGIIKGQVGSYKKAIVTLAEGETLDFFGDI
jgi:large subunit ribosomal protein L23